MKRRRWQNTWLRQIAMKKGLRTGEQIVIRERSLLKDYSYITRQKRYGVVLRLYPNHFYCRMEDGTKESFRYNEFLGYESRIICLRESRAAGMTDREWNQIEKAS